MTEQVLSRLEDGVLTLRLDRPDKKNALTPAMYTALARALEAADADPQVRVVVLTGGPDCFTSGNDISDFLHTPPADQSNPVFTFMWALFDLEKPVVAAVAGPAVGIGTTLLLHCDLVYVAQDAVLRMPFVNLGLCPEYGSSLVVPRLVGHARAARLLLLSEAFSGQQAADWGIASEALDDGAAALARAQEAARALAALAPGAVTDSKRLMRAPGRDELRRVITEEGDVFAQRLRSPEAVEALSAFVERRVPDFSSF
ncbi:enoyl-CoA hydratase-related protein [Sanguibacter sp. 25GB23B1]|uniref:enoyl-CoA hydratase-related protein n=1 Tax=unclassified Sanguibacter TaxID=2645534 RepID=UPI0032AF6255